MGYFIPTGLSSRPTVDKPFFLLQGAGGVCAHLRLVSIGVVKAIFAGFWGAVMKNGLEIDNGCGWLSL